MILPPVSALASLQEEIEQIKQSGNTSLTKGRSTSSSSSKRKPINPRASKVTGQPWAVQAAIGMKVEALPANRDVTVPCGQDTVLSCVRPGKHCSGRKRDLPRPDDENSDGQESVEREQTRGQERQFSRIPSLIRVLNQNQNGNNGKKCWPRAIVITEEHLAQYFDPSKRYRCVPLSEWTTQKERIQ